MSAGSAVRSNTNTTAAAAVFVNLSIDDATLSFIRAIKESSIQPHPSQALAWNAFDVAYSKWNPQAFSDIKPTDKGTLDILFTSSTSAATENSYDDVFKKKIRRYQRMIRNIVQQWNDSLTAGTLPLSKLRAAKSTINSATWDSYIAAYKWQQLENSAENEPKQKRQRTSTSSVEKQLQQLPALHELSSDTIQTEIDDVRLLQQTIKEYTRVNFRGHVHILRGSKIPVCKLGLREELTRIHAEIGTDQDYTYLLTYFRKYHSIMMPRFETATMCKDCFKTVIGPDMSYSGVGTVLDKLGEEDIIDREIMMLLNCKALKISALDVANFRAVQLLHRLQKPLQEFVNFFTWDDVVDIFRIDSDESTITLEIAVKTFYSAKSNDRQACLAFHSALHSVLCTAPDFDDTDSTTVLAEDHPYSAMLQKNSQLNKVLPALVPVSYLFRGQDLQKWFRDMGWLSNDADIYGGDTGLQQFHSDYDMLSTLLMKYGAVTELSMIDSLTPVVRLCFLVEQHGDCTRVCDFISNLKNDADIQTILLQDVTEKLKEDFHDLENRVCFMRDLFQRLSHLSLAPPPPVPMTIISAVVEPVQVDVDGGVATTTITITTTTVETAKAGGSHSRTYVPNEVTSATNLK